MSRDGNTPTRTRRVYDTLRDMIMRGALPPGESYLETELAERLGVSRTPLREACLRLEENGFVSIRPRLGIRINPISARDMAEIYDILTELEPYAAARLAETGLSPEARSALETALKRMDAAIAEGDLAAWAGADRDFHATLVESTGNRRLVAIFSSLWDQVHRARLATLAERRDLGRSNDDHRALVDLIAAGDAQGAEALHRSHRRQAREVLVALLKTHGEDGL